MVITSYNAKVAAAHGFKIVHNADGTESSVPVTAAAKMEMLAVDPATRAQISRTANANTAASPDNVGNCGTDSLIIYAQPSTQGIVINTGYSVNFTSIGQVWHVIGRTENVSYNEPFNGANFSTTWNATHVKHPISGFGHGFGDIQTGSYAILLNGGTCSALPEGSDW